MKSQAVKGTFDILPATYAAQKNSDVHKNNAGWRYIYAKTEQILQQAGVLELSPPIIEHLEVFTKSVGESSDIVVQKELYSFPSGKDKMLALRPELTAGVMRAFIENGLHVQALPVKLWTRGPIFRAERPQRGRYRQFHQFNCEFIGLAEPIIDAEAIALLYTIFRELGLKNMQVKLGSVGDPEDRHAYNAYLREELGKCASELSATSQERLRLNPMRVLDSKDANDQALIAELKRPLDFLNTEARAHFEGVRRYLEILAIPYAIEPAMVRGLDYYRRTAFEIHHDNIGAQSALCGGGRYDGLIKSLGGQDMPGIGWAFGVERILDALQSDAVSFPKPAASDCYLLPLDETALDEVFALAFRLRQQGLQVEQSYKVRKVAKALQEASKSGARFAVLRGDNERTNEQYQLKNLQTGEQHALDEAALCAYLKDNADNFAHHPTIS